MRQVLRLVVAVVAGFVVGSAANMGLISVLDLLLAYLPAAWLGHRLAAREAPGQPSRPSTIRGAA